MGRPSALRVRSGRGEHESNDEMQTARAEPIRYTYEDYLTFPDDGSFPRVADLSREEGHSLDAPLLPGFALSLAELLA